MFNLTNIVRKHLIDLEPYSSARDDFQGEAKIFLDANENALGSVGDQLLNRYPDPYQQKIKAELAKQKGLNHDQIFLGNGSDEGIDLLIRAFCEPGCDNILIFPPTYGMYKVSANIHNVAIHKVPLTEEFLLDEPSLFKTIDKHTKIIFFCNPNNPTGNLLQKEVMLKVLQHFNGIVVIDEAYIDFSPSHSFLKFIEDYPNLVILQTFSKAWGLAALRLGMAFAHREIIKILNKIKPPYNINELTQKEALHVLSQVAKKDSFVDKILSEKSILVQQLSNIKLILKIFPSATNFILVKVNEPEKVYDYLVAKEIVVRNRSTVQHCGGCLRITVGSKQENEMLINALKKY